MKKCLVLLLFIMIPLTLVAKTKWSEAVVKKFPAQLQKIKIRVTTMKEAEKILGKPALIEKNKHYYEEGGFKYSLEITYDKNTVKEISYTFITPKPSFEPSKIGIDVNKMELYPANGPGAGKYFQFSNDEGNLIIDPVNKTLYSVRLK